MQLEGIHHVTAITAEAQRNVTFYGEVLGLRMVKKTVNHDAPDVYHLYYGDEHGAPGSVMTFFEFPKAAPGRHGAGMVHRVVWRVGGTEALDFWADRLQGAGVAVEHGDGALRFDDPEGLGLELRARSVPDPPLVASARDIPAEHALLGFDGVRAYTEEPAKSTGLLEHLGMGATGADEWEAAGDQRRAFYAYERAPGRGFQGAGTVHHVAWASRDEDHERWREAATGGGASPTPVIDRMYFRSIYFREPSGVLFEIATLSPGFAVDEPWETLGEQLVLPPWLERHRPEIEARLTPVTSPRAARA